MSMSPWKYNFIKKNPTKQQVLEMCVRAGGLAPSTHNSQPWEVSLKENGVVVHDTEMRLPHSDPDSRYHWISVGCFVENFAVCADYYGFSTTLTRNLNVLDLDISPKQDSKSFGNLLPEVNRRYSEKRVFKSKPFPKIDSLSEIGDKTQQIELFTDAETIKKSSEVQFEMSKAFKNNKLFARELSSWLKISSRHHVGMHSHSSGLSLPKLIVGKSALVLTPKPLGAMAQKYLHLVGNSSAVGFISSKSQSIDDSIDCGRVLERLSLVLTKHNLSLTPLAAMTEVEKGKNFLKSISKAQDKTPAMFFRIGDRKEPVYHTTRKPYNIVIRK